ncbi:hypothetical protein NKG94_48015 [Micromonospora sp. M12]
MLGLLALAVVLLVGWLVTEMRSSNPLIDMRMMRLPGVWTTNLVALLYGASMFSVYAFLPSSCRPRQPPVTASGEHQPGRSAHAPDGQCDVRRRHHRRATPGRFQRQGAARHRCHVQRGRLGDARHRPRHPLEVAIAGGLVGLGIGLAFASMANLIVASVPASQTGVATGMNANIRTIGGAIGAAVVSGVITAHPQANGLPRRPASRWGFSSSRRSPWPPRSRPSPSRPPGGRRPVAGRPPRRSSSPS